MNDDKPLSEGVSARFVECRPSLEDPEIVERKHRASCLLKLLPRCSTCPNSKFTLFFNLPEKRLEQVQCPRWKSIADLHGSKNPEEYVVTEVATCEEKPFPFCGSCPSKAELQKSDIDKTKDGWYSRWVRFRKDADDHRVE